MSGFVAAAFAAFGWGLDAVLARQGLRRLPPATATFLSICASLSAAIVLVLVFDSGGLRHYPLRAFGWFATIGVINFLLGRQCNFAATKRLGAARSAAIFATSPLVSIGLALLLTGERLNPLLLAGAVLVMLGVMLVVTS